MGNLPEDFREKGPKIIIILDNASYHKKKDVIEQVEKELPNIRLEFLPAYSPDYNLIEGSSVCVMQWTGVIRDGTLIEKGSGCWRPTCVSADNNPSERR